MTVELCMLTTTEFFQVPAHCIPPCATLSILDHASSHERSSLNFRLAALRGHVLTYLGPLRADTFYRYVLGRSSDLKKIRADKENLHRGDTCA